MSHFSGTIYHLCVLLSFKKKKNLHYHERAKRVFLLHPYIVMSWSLMFLSMQIVQYIIMCIECIYFLRKKSSFVIFYRQRWHSSNRWECPYINQKIEKNRNSSGQSICIHTPTSWLMEHWKCTAFECKRKRTQEKSGHQNGLFGLARPECPQQHIIDDPEWSALFYA